MGSRGLALDYQMRGWLEVSSVAQLCDVLRSLLKVVRIHDERDVRAVRGRNGLGVLLSLSGYTGDKLRIRPVFPPS